jgi:hypothetical protein
LAITACHALGCDQTQQKGAFTAPFNHADVLHFDASCGISRDSAFPDYR